MTVGQELGGSRLYRLDDFRHLLLVPSKEAVPSLLGMYQLISDLDLEVSSSPRVPLRHNFHLSPASLFQGILGGIIMPPVPSSTTPLNRDFYCSSSRFTFWCSHCTEFKSVGIRFN